MIYRFISHNFKISVYMPVFASTHFFYPRHNHSNEIFPHKPPSERIIPSTLDFLLSAPVM